MKEKSWETEWLGRTIRAINRSSVLPPRTSEALEVDGELAAENRSGLTQMFATVREDVDFHGETKPVEARFAQKAGWPRLGCHILVDGKLVGGDTDAQLQYPDPQETKDWYREGPFQFILRKGLPSYGLPFAIVMAFVNGQGSLEGNLVAFAINLVGFGTAMGYFHWRSIKKQAGQRQG